MGQSYGNACCAIRMPRAFGCVCAVREHPAPDALSRWPLSLRLLRSPQSASFPMRATSAQVLRRLILEAIFSWLTVPLAIRFVAPVLACADRPGAGEAESGAVLDDAVLFAGASGARALATASDADRAPIGVSCNSYGHMLMAVVGVCALVLQWVGTVV